MLKKIKMFIKENKNKRMKFSTFSYESIMNKLSSFKEINVFDAEGNMAKFRFFTGCQGYEFYGTCCRLELSNGKNYSTEHRCVGNYKYVPYFAESDLVYIAKDFFNNNKVKVVETF